MSIADFDDELSQAITAEEQRQEDHIELIASENYASPRVLEAQGSLLTNKYAEGYPGKRYYGGCSMLILSKRWQSNALRHYLVRIMRMYSHIPGLRLMRRSIWLY